MLFLHWIGNRMLSLVTNVLYNTTLSDMETCYKLVDRTLLLDLDLRCNRFDIEPEITAKILKRRIRIYEVPISYIGPRVRRRQEDHLARRLRGVVDAGQVPLCRLIRTRLIPIRNEPAWAAVVVNYEAGPLLVDCVASVLADTSAGRRRARRRRQRLARRLGRRRSSPRFPTCVWCARPGNVGYARAANLGTAATKAPIVAVLNPDTVIEAGTARRAARSAASASPGSAACGPAAAQSRRHRLPVGARPSRRSRSRSVTGCSASGGRRTRSRPGTASSTPTRRVPRLVDWVSGAAIWLRRAALDEVGGWDERYFMYLEDTDLCWRLRRAGWEVAYEPAAVIVHVQGVSTSRRPYRMLLEHHRSAWRFAQTRLTGFACGAASVRGRLLRAARGARDGRARVGGPGPDVIAAAAASTGSLGRVSTALAA